jgi:ribonuclease P protein component
LKNRFCEEERLKGKKTFGELVKTGNSLYLFPFRAIYSTYGSAENENVFPANLGISVSKKKFKRAVDRNRIKRYIRESYRKIKEQDLYPFLKDNHISLKILLIYIHSEILDAETFQLKIGSILKKLKNVLKPNL